MKNIVREDLYQYHFLSELSVSPDGKNAAFVVRQANPVTNGYDAHIWLLDTSSGQSRPLTGNGDETAFHWADSETLIFPSARGGDQPGTTAFYRLSLSGGEAERAFTVPMAARMFRPLPDGRYFLLARRPMETVAEQPDRAKLGKDYQVFDELPFWGDGIGAISGTRLSGFLFDPADGSCKQLTAKRFDLEGAEVSPDGKRILFWGVAFSDLRPDWKQLCEYDLESGETRCLLPEGKFRPTQVGYWGDDIWMEATAPHESVFRSPELYLINRQSGEAQVFCSPDGFLATSGIGDMSLGGGRLWKAEGESLYAFRLNRGDAEILRFRKDGSFTALASFEGVACLDVSGDSLYAVAFADHRPQELYHLSLTGGAVSRKSVFHDAFLATHKVSLPRHIVYKSRTGTELDGWILEPMDYEPGKKYPGVLNIHGGPKAAYSGQFYHEMQLLAAEGRFVFYTNPHGSDGRGQDFFDLVGKWGTVDYDDFMDFTDEVLHLCPDVDKTRLGVCGGSYGGYMTNWIIGHTERFKAAVSMRCLVNFFTSMGTCDKGYLFLREHLGVSPWEDPDKTWDMSPLKYVGNVKTPTLYIHSNTDFRCYMGESMQMFTSLRQMDVPTKIVLIHNEGHELNRSGRPKSRLIRLEALSNWFYEYLK